MQIIRGISLASLFMLIGASTAAYAQSQPAQHNNQENTTRTTPQERLHGVLVMAHGGSEDWDAGVLQSMAPLKEQYPLEVAFGMADAWSLQQAVSKLEQQGVTDIAVVRLFISGESWYDRTRQILGMEEGAPARAEADGHEGHHPAMGNGHRMEFWQIDSNANFTLSTEGLSEAPEMTDVLLDRAKALSEQPSTEDVLILAHGTGDDEANDRWLAEMTERSQLLIEQGGFNEVKIATLREDWPEKREQAQQDIRNFVANSAAAGRTPIVIPYRVHGFGPYTEILEGLDYVSDGQGLIPHPGVTRWIERQITELQARQVTMLH